MTPRISRDLIPRALIRLGSSHLAKRSDLSPPGRGKLRGIPFWEARSFSSPPGYGIALAFA